MFDDTDLRNYLKNFENDLPLGQRVTLYKCNPMPNFTVMSILFTYWFSWNKSADLESTTIPLNMISWSWTWDDSRIRVSSYRCNKASDADVERKKEKKIKIG